MRLRDYEGANIDAAAFKNNKLINEKHYNNFKTKLEKARQNHTFFDQ